MSDSDNGSVAHAHKARKGQDGQVAKLRNRSSAQPSSSGAPAASSAIDPSAHPPTGLPADPSAVPPADALTDLLARIGALEQNQADTQ
ncbi:TPA: hypothetical protein ACH3X1_007639 [Trebouxia sp. C0004]